LVTYTTERDPVKPMNAQQLDKEIRFSPVENGAMSAGG
jgi:hypothetical protein